MAEADADQLGDSLMLLICVSGSSGYRGEAWRAP
jgi:hypothetical protein